MITGSRDCCNMEGVLRCIAILSCFCLASSTKVPVLLWSSSRQFLLRHFKSNIIFLIVNLILYRTLSSVSLCRVGLPRNAKIYCILIKFTRFSLYPDLFYPNNVCVFICTFNKKEKVRLIVLILSMKVCHPANSSALGGLIRIWRWN